MMKIEIEVAHKIGDIVFLITDPEQMERMVLGYTLRKTNVFYELVQGVNNSVHYEDEIASEKDILKLTTN